MFAYQIYQEIQEKQLALLREHRYNIELLEKLLDAKASEFGEKGTSKSVFITWDDRVEISLKIKVSEETFFKTIKGIERDKKKLCELAVSPETLRFAESIKLPGVEASFIVTTDMPEHVKEYLREEGKLRVVTESNEVVVCNASLSGAGHEK
jgi:hypothetical protein